MLILEQTIVRFLDVSNITNLKNQVEIRKFEMEKMENQHSSAVAFVEGGTQDACEDNCSICLEPFCNSDPSTVLIQTKILYLVMYFDFSSVVSSSDWLILFVLI